MTDPNIQNIYDWLIISGLYIVPVVIFWLFFTRKYPIATALFIFYIILLFLTTNFLSL